MDKQQMDKDSVKNYIVNGEQIENLIDQFETIEDIKIFISNFVRTFEMVSDIWENKKNEKKIQYVGSLLHIMIFFSRYSKELNRMTQIFEPYEITQEQLELLRNDTNSVVHQFKNGEVI